MTEQSTANHLGRHGTVLNTDSLSRFSAVTKRTRNVSEGECSKTLLRIVSRLSLRTLSRLGFVWLLIGCLQTGCGPAKTPAPSLTPREVKTDVERLSLVRFSSDGKLLAAGSANGELLVWRELGDPPIKLNSGHSSPLLCLEWSPDGLAVITDLDRGLIGWSFHNPEPTRVELPGLPSAAVCLAFRPKTKLLEFVLGMRDGSLVFVDSRGSKQIKPDHRGTVKQAIYSLDGNWLVTAGSDGQLIWRDTTTRNVTQAVKTHDTEISRLLLSVDGQLLISGDWNGWLKVWDMSTRKSQREFHQSEAVSGLGWVGKELVSASWDGSLHGWNVSTGSCLRTFVTGQAIHDLASDSNRSQVATVSLDHTLQVRDWPVMESR